MQMHEYPYQCVFTLGVVSFSVQGCLGQVGREFSREYSSTGEQTLPKKHSL